MNIGAPWPGRDKAWNRVPAMQTKLHRWAKDDPGRRFDDLYNLVYDPASSSRRGAGSRATRAREPPGSTGSHHARSPAG